MCSLFATCHLSFGGYTEPVSPLGLRIRLSIINCLKLAEALFTETISE
jgi:hypothetical protein